MRKFWFLLALGFLTGQLVSAQVATPAGLATSIEGATQGEVISLDGVNALDCPYVDMSTNWQAGGELIFSDSPESPTTTGILYEDDTQPGNVTNRIFAYHVNNNSSSEMRFSVLIKNLGSSSGTLTVQQVGLAGPSTLYSVVGQDAFERWLTSTQGTPVSVAAGATVRLDTNFDTVSVVQGDLLHGIWDYSFTQPHEVIICALTPSENPLTTWSTLPVLARDTHERGTYVACNKIYNNVTNYDTAQGISIYPIGDGVVDLSIPGHDYAVTPPTAEFHDDPSGVLYRTHLTVTSSNGDNLAILVNPRGGAWQGAVYAQAGILPGGKFIIPADGGATSANTNGTVEGYYSAPDGSYFMQFMPTGGSNFPVDMMLVPVP